jgi:two-component system response regulator RegA
VSSFLFGSRENPPEANKVLVVDSDPKRVAEISAGLRERGYVPLDATTFEAAKRLWIAERPAMLIADVRLGQFNGLQLLLRAHADRPDLIAVITCAFEDKVLEAETQRFGGIFLVKPVGAEEVIATLLRSRPESRPMPALVDRRHGERRETISPDFDPERRAADRRRSPKA